MDESIRAARLARALGDPLRFALLQHLMAGPAAVAELAAETGASQSNVSNHLALLRAERLVRNERRGRTMIYQIRDPLVAELIETLTAVAGAGPHLTGAQAPITVGRTCYDHLAGKLGVALFSGLAEAGAIVAPESAGGEAQLGPAAAEVFAALGVAIEPARRAKRKFAHVCLDWTERDFHLGGALGAAVCARFLEAGWVERQPGTRAVRLTPTGSAALEVRVNISVPLVESDQGVAPAATRVSGSR
jgi:DNA-binding transcriptional ArsR family regulator